MGDCGHGGNPVQPNVNKKREDKVRRRDPKAWENISKTFSGLTESEKVDALAAKYNDLYNESRTNSVQLLNLERQQNAIQREKDHLQSEHTKSILAKARLEDLCRELQKQNKQIKEENMAKLKDEEERRREVSAQLTEKLKEITNIMDETNSKSVALYTENIVMQSKISKLTEQFKDRDKHITQMIQERQQANATESQLQLQFLNERKIWNCEQEKIITNLEQCQENCKLLQANNESLQKQLEIYKNQYSHFESTMVKSGEVFTNLKQELALMCKKVVHAEKEAIDFKNKWQTSSNTAIHLTELYHNQEIALKNSNKKIEKLQNLCRQLQSERTAYLKLLKAFGIDTTIAIEETEKVQEAPTTPKPLKKEKPTSKQMELALLKKEMKQYQQNLVNEPILEGKKNDKAITVPAINDVQTELNESQNTKDGEVTLTTTPHDNSATTGFNSNTSVKIEQIVAEDISNEKVLS